MNKSKKIFALTLLTSLLLIAVLFASVMTTQAQSQATVTVIASVGGTTTPGVGTTTYADGQSVTFTATPDDGFAFSNWIVSTDAGSNVAVDNPLTIPVVGGITYTVQAVYQPIFPIPGPGLPVMSTAAIIVVLASAGGTTTPEPGTYALADASSTDLTAIPDSGWQFSHWVISGPGLSHGGYPFTATPTDNPYNVNHGYGNRFVYQAIFTPVGSTEPTPSVPEFSSIATIIVALALVAVALGTYTLRHRTK